MTAKSQEITILHTNDLHSRLNGFSPESEYTPLSVNDDPTVGGFSRIATLFKQEKEKSDNVLILDAGDFLMGTLFHYLEPETGFQLSLMHEMGYDFVALGNHEFDFGPEKLAQLISIGKRNGAIPSLMLSNIRFSDHSDADNALEKLYNEGQISRVKIINKGDTKIGLFSIIGKDATESAKSAKPVRFTNPVRTARKMVRFLKNSGVDLIIALSHSGIEKGNEGDIRGEDVELAKKVDGIDLIISGHSHTNLTGPVKINQTHIVQVGSYGERVGKIKIKNTRNAPAYSFSSININDSIPGDKTIQKKIDRQKELVKEHILLPLGLNYHQDIFETDFPLLIDRQDKIEKGNLGPFIADAILHETNLLEGGNTNIAIIPAGMIRGNILPGRKGFQSPADLFNTLSLGIGNDSVPGYPLSRIFLTGKELKKIVEVLLIAYKTGASKYVYYSGIRITYDPEKFLLSQVKTIDVLNNNGEYESVNLDDNVKLYGLVGNSYLLNFIYMVKEMSFGIVSISPKKADGSPIKKMSEAVLDFDTEKSGIQEGKEWISVINFSKTFDDINNNGVPDIPIIYKEKMNPVYVFKNLPGTEITAEKEPQD